MVVKRIDRQESAAIISQQKSMNYGAATKLWEFIKDGTTESVWWNKHTNCKAVAYYGLWALTRGTAGIAIIPLELLAWGWGSVGSLVMGCEYDKSRDNVIALLDKVDLKPQNERDAPAAMDFEKKEGWWVGDKAAQVKAFNESQNARLEALEAHARLVVDKFAEASILDFSDMIEAAVIDFRNSSTFRSLPSEAKKRYAVGELRKALWDRVPVVLAERMKEFDPIKRQQSLVGADEAYHGASLGAILNTLVGQAQRQGVTKYQTVQQFYNAMAMSLNEGTEDIKALFDKMQAQLDAFDDVDNDAVDPGYMQAWENLEDQLAVTRRKLNGGDVDGEDHPGYGDFFREVEAVRVPSVSAIYDRLAELSGKPKGVTARDLYISSEELQKIVEELKTEKMTEIAKGENKKAQKAQKEALKQRFKAIDNLMSAVTEFDEENEFDDKLSAIQALHKEVYEQEIALQNLKAGQGDDAEKLDERKGALIGAVQTALAARASEALEFVRDAQNIMNAQRPASKQDFLQEVDEEHEGDEAEDASDAAPAIFVPKAFNDAEFQEHLWDQIQISRDTAQAALGAVVPPAEDPVAEDASEHPKTQALIDAIHSRNAAQNNRMNAILDHEGKLAEAKRELKGARKHLKSLEDKIHEKAEEIETLAKGSAQRKKAKKEGQALAAQQQEISKGIEVLEEQIEGFNGTLKSIKAEYTKRKVTLDTHLEELAKKCPPNGSQQQVNSLGSVKLNRILAYVKEQQEANKREIYMMRREADSIRKEADVYITRLNHKIDKLNSLTQNAESAKLDEEKQRILQVLKTGRVSELEQSSTTLANSNTKLAQKEGWVRAALAAKDDQEPPVDDDDVENPDEL